MLSKLQQGTGILYNVCNLKMPGGQGALLLQLSPSSSPQGRLKATQVGDSLSAMAHRQQVIWGKGELLQLFLRAEQQPGLPGSNSCPAEHTQWFSGCLSGCVPSLPHPFHPAFTVLWDRAGAQAPLPKHPARPPCLVTHFPCSRSCFRHWPF